MSNHLSPEKAQLVLAHLLNHVCAQLPIHMNDTNTFSTVCAQLPIHMLDTQYFLYSMCPVAASNDWYPILSLQYVPSCCFKCLIPNTFSTVCAQLLLHMLDTQYFLYSMCLVAASYEWYQYFLYSMCPVAASNAWCLILSLQYVPSSCFMCLRCGHIRRLCWSFDSCHDSITSILDRPYSHISQESYWVQIQTFSGHKTFICSCLLLILIQNGRRIWFSSKK